MEGMGTEALAMAGPIKGVAWLIPYCTHYDPLNWQTNGHPSTAWAFRCSSGWWPGSLRLRASGEHSSFLDPLQLEAVWQAQTARVERAHYPSVAAIIDPVCALREHMRLPDHLKPASW